MINKNKNEEVSKAASMLGKLSKGIPKTGLTQSELERRSNQLKIARSLRWPAKLEGKQI